MKIYIAASWKHRFAVELLTKELRSMCCEVLSFVENNGKEGNKGINKNFDFEDWVHSPEALRCFEYDIKAAATSDLVIYIGPSGKDACIEIGIAFANSVPVVALIAKGEDLGLMRHIFHKTFFDIKTLYDFLKLRIEWEKDY